MKDESQWWCQRDDTASPIIMPPPSHKWQESQAWKTANGKDHDAINRNNNLHSPIVEARKTPDSTDCLPLRWSAELAPVLDTQDFVEGLLTTSCLAVVYGASNVGKSFWVIDLGLRIAGGIRWNGREVEHGIVILIALEGGRMVDNRIITARERLELSPTVPLVLVQCPIDLRSSGADAERLANTIRLAVSQFLGPLPVRLVIIDTMSRALSGGDEGAEDMSALLANVDRVRAETGVAILFVAHSGKDAGKGIRGWSGIRAAIDVEIEMTRLTDDAGFVAVVTKARDLPIGDRFAFKLEVVEIGRNQRGKLVSTCIVQHTGSPDATPKRITRGKRLTDHHMVFREHLLALIATHGEPITPSPGMPIVRGVTREALRLSLIQCGWFHEGQLCDDGKPRKAAYSDENNALTALKRQQDIGFDRVYAWVI